MVKATRCRQGVWLCNTLWCKRLVCVFDHSMLRCQTSLFLGYKKAVTGWYRLALSRVSATDGKLIFPSNNISSVHTFIVSDTGPDKSMGSDLEVKVKRQNLYDLHCLSYLHHKAKPDCIAKISHIICITVCIWGGKLESGRTLQEKLLKLCSDYINTLENHFMPITDYRVQKERLLSFWLHAWRSVSRRR